MLQSDHLEGTQLLISCCCIGCNCSTVTPVASHKPIRDQRLLLVKPLEVSVRPTAFPINNNQHFRFWHCHSKTACAGGLTASLPELPKAGTSGGNSPLHDVDPNINDTASSQSRLTPVKPSPASPGHPFNVPAGHHALDVSDVVSPIAANRGSYSGETAKSMVSGAQCNSSQAFAAWQCARSQPIHALTQLMNTQQLRF